LRLAPFPTSQPTPTDLVGDFGSLSSFTRVDPVSSDRRVADSFCTGLNPDALESQTSCSSPAKQRMPGGRGMVSEATCVTTAVNTRLFRRPLTEKIQLTVKNLSSTELNRPFDVEIRAGDARVQNPALYVFRAIRRRNRLGEGDVYIGPGRS
jgi:hypothetical protein